MTFDWDSATVKVTVPVHHTATIEKQEVDVPLKVFVKLLSGNDDLPLVILEREKTSPPTGPACDGNGYTSPGTT